MRALQMCYKFSNYNIFCIFSYRKKARRSRSLPWDIKFYSAMTYSGISISTPPNSIVATPHRSKYAGSSGLFDPCA